MMMNEDGKHRFFDARLHEDGHVDLTEATVSEDVDGLPADIAVRRTKGAKLDTITWPDGTKVPMIGSWRPADQQPDDDL